MDLDIVASHDDLFGENKHLSSQESAHPAPRLKSVIVVPDMPAALTSSGFSSRHSSSRTMCSSSRRNGTFLSSIRHLRQHVSP
ncbi:hypothetical protein MHYP_G00248980 [Metynnis hypsauchen]